MDTVKELTSEEQN